MTTNQPAIKLYPLFKSGKVVIALLSEPQNSKASATVMPVTVPDISKVPFPKWEEANKSYTLYEVSGTITHSVKGTAFNPDLSTVSGLPVWEARYLQEYLQMYFYQQSVPASPLPKGTIEFMDDQHIRFHYTHGPLVDRTEILYISDLLNNARKLSKYRKYKALLREAQQNGSLVVPLLGNDMKVISLAIDWGRLLDGGFLPQDFN